MLSIFVCLLSITTKPPKNSLYRWVFWWFNYQFSLIIL